MKGAIVERNDAAESQAELKEMLAELTTDQEKVSAGGGSAAEPLVVLPDVPATEPADQGPSPKKQKGNDEARP